MVDDNSKHGSDEADIDDEEAQPSLTTDAGEGVPKYE